MASSSSSSRNQRSRFVLPISSLSCYVLCLLGFSAVCFLFSQSQISRVFSEDPPPPIHNVEVDQLWDSSFSRGFQPCIKPTRRYQAPQVWERYLTVRSNGGLNQMRTGICDMVAVARIMNATLVIPQLDKKSFWQDTSTFSDIFDESHFIKALQGDLRIVSQLPKELESSPRARKHFTSWSGVGYYEEMTELWKEHQVIHVPKSDSRLANNNLPVDIQRLRCRALYTALRFSSPIEDLGKVLRLRGADITEAS